MGCSSLVSVSNNNPLDSLAPFLLRPSKHFMCNVPFKPPVPREAAGGCHVKRLQQLFSSLQMETLTASVLNVGELSHGRVKRTAKGTWYLMNACYVHLVLPTLGGASVNFPFSWMRKMAQIGQVIFFKVTQPTTSRLCI